MKTVGEERMIKRVYRSELEGDRLRGKTRIEMVLRKYVLGYRGFSIQGEMFRNEV